MGDYKPVHESSLVTIKSVTASETLAASEYGQVVSVDSASGAVTLTLPAAVAGASYKIVRNSATAGEDVVVTPASGESINGSVDGSITNDVDAVGAMIEIVCVVDGAWVTNGALSDW